MLASSNSPKSKVQSQKSKVKSQKSERESSRVQSRENFFKNNHELKQIRPFQENKSSKPWRFPSDLPLMLHSLNLGTTLVKIRED
jgi:hypothetical protein